MTADLDYPATLPGALFEGNSFSGGEDDVYVFQPSEGPRHVRAKSSDTCDQIPVSSIMTLTQLNSWFTFRKSTTVNGSAPFNWTHPFLGTACICLFIGGWNVEKLALDKYKLSFAVEIRPFA